MLAACSQRRAEANLAGAPELEAMAGAGVFKTHCQKCHPDGEAGVGPAINSVPLPGFLTRYRIRSRSFLLWTGRMPAFKHDEISGGDMDALIAYIKKLRRAKPAAETKSL